MSLSPTDSTGNAPDNYLSGWEAVQKMVRDGLSWSGYERNCTFLNTQGPRFADASAVSGLDFDDDARAVAFVDWDFDGRLDLWLANRTGPRLRFMHNVAPPQGSFVAIALTGSTCNRDALGARVEVHLKGQAGPPLMRTLRGGEGYLAQSSKWLHFGLPRGAELERVLVRWPGGKTEEVQGVKQGGFHRVTQGAGQAEVWNAPPMKIGLKEERLKAAPVSDRARVVAFTRMPLPSLQFTDLAGQTRPMQGQGPVLVNLWASWCPNCLLELKGWAAAAELLRASGVRMLALSVDEDEPARAKAKDHLEEMGWSFEAGFAAPELIDVLDIAQKTVLERDRRIPLPSSFLLNAEGQIAFIYKGPVEANVLLADAKLLGASPAELRQTACPFPGTWVSVPAVADLVKFADVLGQRGHAALAAEILGIIEKSKAIVEETRLAGARMNFGVALQREGKYQEAAEVFRELLKRQPDRPDILNNLGNALGGLRQFEEALKCFQEALRLKPDNVDIMANMAAPLRALGRASEAEAVLRRVLEIYPGHTKGMNDLAMVLVEQNRGSEALPLLRRVIGLDPGNVPAIFNLALLTGRAGQLPEAVELCKRVVALEPGHTRAYTFMGVMYQRQNQPREAVAAYEEALRLSPDNPTALQNLCVVLLNEGDIEGAQRYAQLLDQLQPGRAAPIFAEIEKKRAGAKP